MGFRSIKTTQFLVLKVGFEPNKGEFVRDILVVEVRPGVKYTAYGAEGQGSNLGKIKEVFFCFFFVPEEFIRDKNFVNKLGKIGKYNLPM